MKKMGLPKTIVIGLIIMATLLPMVNAEESTLRPQPLKIRKVTIEENQAYVWIYVNTNIKSELRYDEMSGEFFTMYGYDMKQLKIPIDSKQITNQERELLAYTSYPQTSIRSRLTDNLKDSNFLSKLSQEVNTESKQVNQKEQETEIKYISIVNTLKNKILLGCPLE